MYNLIQYGAMIVIAIISVIGGYKSGVANTKAKWEAEKEKGVFAIRQKKIDDLRYIISQLGNSDAVQIGTTPEFMAVAFHFDSVPDILVKKSDLEWILEVQLKLSKLENRWGLV